MCIHTTIHNTLAVLMLFNTIRTRSRPLSSALLYGVSCVLVSRLFEDY
jgi:hypothetical protein